MNAVGSGVLLADRYRLEHRLAGGGMGEVWRAQDVVLCRDVAVKLLRAELTDDADFRGRFRGEARHAARLSHPGIASVFDFGELPDRAWLVLELVEGESLSELLHREGRLSPERTLDIVRQAAEALQAAHASGVVHRDVKPGNLLVRRDGAVKVTDFGIASATGSVPLTRTGQIIGTASYLSPEQAAGRTATAASDLYALGVVAYECLSGTRPFVADTPVAILYAHLHTPPPQLPEHVPPDVRGVIERLLSKEPADRPASAGELARELAGLERGQVVAGRSRKDGGGTRVLGPAAASTGPAARSGGVVQETTGATSRRTQRRAVRGTAMLLLALTGAVAARGALTDGSTRVPDIAPGTSAARAAATLVQADLDPAQRPQSSTSIAAGQVVSLRPTSGSEVDSGTQVVLLVSTGPKPTAPSPTAAPTSAGSSTAARSSTSAGPSPRAQDPARQTGPGPATPVEDAPAPARTEADEQPRDADAGREAADEADDAGDDKGKDDNGKGQDKESGDSAESGGKDKGKDR